MNVVDEPVGENCISGGIKIESGIDADGNGTLDGSEVSEQTTCAMVLHLLMNSPTITQQHGNDTAIDLIDWYNDFSEQDCADYHLSIAMETSDISDENSSGDTTDEIECINQYTRAYWCV